MAFIIGFLIALLLIYLTRYAYRLAHNVSAARKLGLPYLVYPFDSNHMLWRLVSIPLRPWLQRHLPSPIWDRLTLTIYGWDFHQKRRPFDEYAAPQGDGRSFVIVGSGSLQIWTADVEFATAVYKRPNDFERPTMAAVLFGQFGNNIFTTNGERWAKQRKVVASAINERVSKIVFDTTMYQTTGMLEELQLIGHNAEKPSAESNRMFDMLKQIAIHVLTEVGMGTRIPWNSQGSEKPAPGYKMTYIEASKVVMDSITGPIAIPTNWLLNWPSWLPGHQKLKQLGIGKQEFPIHTKALFKEERQRLSEDKTASERSNFMSQLIRASAEQGNTHTGLTEEELTGNLFLFTAAGFETTANALCYAFMLLARYPQWQEWVLEEVDSVMPKREEEVPEYSTIFPQLVRVMAIMFETLRLYTPVVHVVRRTATPQQVKTSNATITVPANSKLYICNFALHLDPEVWRDINHDADPPWVTADEDNKGHGDEYTFRPSRWINRDKSERVLYQPPKGYFVPWGHGARVCPGQKMAQVEFAAAMLRLLQRHRIDAVPLSGESPKDIEKRLDRTLNKSISKITLVMEDVYNPGENGGVHMRLSKRN